MVVSVRRVSVCVIVLVALVATGCLRERGRRERMVVGGPAPMIVVPGPAIVGPPPEVILVPMEPPPLRYEVMGRPPVAGHVWVGGAWEWRGGRHDWVPGRWTAPPRRGAAWVAPRWEKAPGGWRHVPGSWR